MSRDVKPEKDGAPANGKTISDTDLGAIEVNGRKVAAGGRASARHWAETALRLVGAVREAREWVRRITAEKQVLTCVYCGKEYPPGTPTHGANVLTAHIKVCEKHPMRALEAALEECRSIADLALADDGPSEDRDESALTSIVGIVDRTIGPVPQVAS